MPTDPKHDYLIDDSREDPVTGELCDSHRYITIRYALPNRSWKWDLHNAIVALVKAMLTSK